MARKYQHIQQLLPQVKEMVEQGMTQKEFANTLGPQAGSDHERFLFRINLLTRMFSA